MRSSNFRGRSSTLIAALLGFAAWSAAGAAYAQTIDVATENSLPRISATGQVLQKRELTLNPEAVNYQDCIDDQSIRFTLLMTGFEANASVQPWASNSADCKTEQNRTGTNAVCWRLAPNVPLQTNVSVDIPVRTIMSGAPPFRPTAPDATINACGQVDLSTINVQFLYFAPGQQSTATLSKDLSITVDTVGPQPPTGLQHKPGNTRIQISWDNISGDGGVTALTGVKAYCDPVGGVGGVADGGATVVQDAGQNCTQVALDGGFADAGDGGLIALDGGFQTVCTDGGASSSGSSGSSGCSAPDFVNPDGGNITPTSAFDAKFKCGDKPGAGGTTVEADSVGGKPLVNGTTYAVAVAATDAYGNIGPLSNVQCETPEETTDFWTSYKNASGGAGGGCTTTRSSSSLSALGGAAAVGVAVVVAASVIGRRGRGQRGQRGQRERKKR